MIIKKKTITTLTILLLTQTFGLNAMASSLKQIGKEGHKILSNPVPSSSLAHFLVKRSFFPNGKSKEFDALPITMQDEIRGKLMDHAVDSMVREFTREKLKSENAREMRGLITDSVNDLNGNEEMKEAKQKLNEKLAQPPTTLNNLNNIDPHTGDPVSIQLLQIKEGRPLLLDYMKKNPGTVDVHRESMGKVNEEGNLFNAGRSLYSMIESAKQRIKDGHQKSFTPEEEELAALVQEQAKK